MLLVELQGKLKTAEMVAEDLKKQISIEKCEMRRQLDLMAESRQVLASKQESIDDLKVEIRISSLHQKDINVMFPVH